MARFKKNNNIEIVKTEREKVEERREEVLANGRKFKYPLQYAKYKLVFVTIIISLVAVGILAVVGWAMLYKVQNTGDIMYRITKVLPVAVAETDGEKVEFADYLMIYRSSIKVVEQQSGQLGEGEDADLLRSDYKRMALNDAEAYTYALKLGREQGVNVSDDEVMEVFNEQRKVGGTDRSEEGFLQVIEDNFGLSKDEYKRLLYLSLMRAKVEEKIDKNANEMVVKVENILRDGEDVAEQVGELGDRVVYEETGGLVGNKNVDGGRANMAAELEPGEWSGKFLSSNGDGYYFVKLIEKTDTQVNYVSIKVPFTEFASRLKKIREEDKIKEYIELQQ